MFYLMQFFIIIAISFLGEILHHFIPLPIPASVYGLVLMLFFLKTKIIKLHHVKDTAKFLIEIMPVMFIPAAVGIIESYSVLKPIIIPVAVITFFVTVIVMAVCGLTCQGVINLTNRKAGK